MLTIDTATETLDGYRPSTESEYRAVFLRHLAQNGRVEQPQAETIRAGIDCGRWMTNCTCGGAVAFHPDWNFAGCLTCGRSWTSIEFPSAEVMAQLEEVFLLRPAGRFSKDRRRYWSWWPESETIDDLRIENALHGWRMANVIKELQS